MTWRGRRLVVTLIAILGFLVVNPAKAETTLGDQILQSDLVLTKLGSPYVVSGLIQVPATKTLVIEPGAVVTFARGGGIRASGDVRVGSKGSGERVILNLNSNLEFLGNGLSPGSVSIFRSDIYANGGALIPGCAKLQIDETYMQNFRVILGIKACPDVIITNSYLKNIDYISSSMSNFQSFVLQNNLFQSILSMTDEFPICGSVNISGSTPIYEGTYIVTNNDFKNLESLTLPRQFSNFNLAMNNFTAVKNVKIVNGLADCGGMVNNVISNNHWSGVSTDSSIRSALKVIDARSDIRIKETIIFEPTNQSPIILQGFPAKADSIDKVVAEKIAAEKIAAARASSRSSADAENATAHKSSAEKISTAKAIADRVIVPLQKKSTITCAKGKNRKIVTSVNPTCPPGYVKKS